jgi:uncharacterized protein (UPF0276 family)
MYQQSNSGSEPSEALGVGITYSPAIEPLLSRYPEEFDVVEIEPQTTWIERPHSPERYRSLGQMLPHLAQLPGRKIVHSIGVPVGGTVRPDPDQLVLLQRTIKDLGAPWMTEHLSFNSTGEFSTGFFLPPLQTDQGVETAVRNIRDLQQAFDVPAGVETGVNYLRRQPHEMADGAFVAAVIETAGCGLLLDLHNIFANSLNGRGPLGVYLAELPLDRVWEIHLAGGLEMDGFWLDAHSGAIPDRLLQITREIVPHLANLKAIVFEIFPSFVPKFGLDSVRREIGKLHELWQMRKEAPPAAPAFAVPQDHIEVADRSEAVRAIDCPDGPQRHNQISPSVGPSPAEWGRTLGGLTVGQPVAEKDRLAIGGALSEGLGSDPGVRLIGRLVHEFRASMVVGVLKLTSRLMMLALGPDTFRMILEDFWSKSPPHQYAASEAEEFANYLETLDLKLPKLGMVMKFERAALATLKDGQSRIVAFDCDPLPMLRALAEGRLPDAPSTVGEFEIEITPDIVDQSIAGAATGAHG